jgi:hypothetical protein
MTSSGMTSYNMNELRVPGCKRAVNRNGSCNQVQTHPTQKNDTRKNYTGKNCMLTEGTQ